MKLLICPSLAVAILATGLSLNAPAAPADGQVDFGRFTAPGKGGEFVEVQLTSNLLSLAAQLVEKEQPEAARLVRSVQLIRVNVVGLTDENREEMQTRVLKIRQDLDKKEWERNVNVQGKDGEDVGVYTKTRGGEALSGIAVTVINPKQIVLVNLVGDIRPDQITALGESLGIKPLKDIGEAIKK